MSRSPASTASATSAAASAATSIKTRRFGPRTLFARVFWLMVVGIAIAQALAYVAIRQERSMALRALMMSGVERDIATGVAVLDRLPAAERADWLKRLERPNYRFALADELDPTAGPVERTDFNGPFVDALVQAMQPFRIERAVQLGVKRYQLLVRLNDGAAVTVHAQRVDMPIPEWVMWVLGAQLIVLAVCSWMVVRLVTRPLKTLASAADDLGPDLSPTLIPEEGPAEVAHAARAFNAMQQRIAGYTAERVEILAAISHDLQTPITRMRLRADLMNDEELRGKFHHDLHAMQVLVREGVTYARTLHGTSEVPARLDADALLASIVGDYQDAGEAVTLAGEAGTPIMAQPQALKRILVNLIDNALAFGGQAEIQMTRSGARNPEGAQDPTPRLTIAVLDRGPGIPDDQLQAVFKPFHRLETSRNRDTGGTGLGLAIALQLATAMGGNLSHHNRTGGGLEARLTLPAPLA